MIASWLCLWNIRLRPNRISKAGDAGATIAFQLDIGDIRVRRLLVDGDRLLVIG